MHQETIKQVCVFFIPMGLYFGKEEENSFGWVGSHLGVGLNVVEHIVKLTWESAHPIWDGGKGDVSRIKFWL